jgi:hypothetical protein
LRDAEAKLVAEVEHIRRKLDLRRATLEIINDIKATMHAPLQPHDLTVFQTLYDRERAKVFNQDAAKAFPGVKEDFDDEIRDIVLEIEAKEAARRVRRLVDHAWKWDHAADRRAREGSATPFKGRPEVYDPGVVWAFAYAIANAAGRERFVTGHHGDVTITDKDDGGGPMFRVLVASVQWAMRAAWQAAAPPGTLPPAVKPEGILMLLRRGRLKTNPTD